jgi:hypothetical protein
MPGSSEPQVNYTPLDAGTLQDVDWGLSMFDQLFNSNPNLLNQPFMDGIMAEGLIDYYEYTGRSRTPRAIHYRGKPAAEEPLRHEPPSVSAGGAGPRQPVMAS